MTMVKCGFSRFVSDSCGQSIASSECISLSQCTRDIKPHLKGFNVIDASIKSESQKKPVYSNNYFGVQFAGLKLTSGLEVHVCTLEWLT